MEIIPIFISMYIFLVYMDANNRKIKYEIIPILISMYIFLLYTDSTCKVQLIIIFGTCIIYNSFLTPSSIYH